MKRKTANSNKSRKGIIPAAEVSRLGMRVLEKHENRILQKR